MSNVKKCFLSVVLKAAGFHMIADSCRSQMIAEPTVAYISVNRSVKITHAVCWREKRSKQHGGCQEGNFVGSKFISSFSG